MLGGCFIETILPSPALCRGHRCFGFGEFCLREWICFRLVAQLFYLLCLRFERKNTAASRVSCGAEAVFYFYLRDGISLPFIFLSFTIEQRKRRYAGEGGDSRRSKLFVRIIGKAIVRFLLAVGGRAKKKCKKYNKTSNSTVLHFVHQADNEAVRKDECKSVEWRKRSGSCCDDYRTFPYS